MGIIPYTCFNLNNFGIVVWCLQNYCVTLPHMSICARIIIAVAFQKIDDAPNAKTTAKRRNERLKDIDCGIEKLHI
mgnify:CR=1 FL=1